MPRAGPPRRKSSSVQSPEHVEQLDGLRRGTETTFTPTKVLRLPTGRELGAAASGYEIHHGGITRGAGVDEFPGGLRAGQVFGTMWHGSLEGDALRGAPRSRCRFFPRASVMNVPGITRSAGAIYKA